MTTEWIHEHIQKRQFKTQSNLKKEIFEKYLNYFKLELIQGEIRVAIQRSTILEMPPFSELKSGPELYQWPAGFPSDDIMNIIGEDTLAWLND